MRGRQPAGPEGALKLEGSEVGRERLRVLLEVAARRCRVGEACRRLGVSASSRFLLNTPRPGLYKCPPSSARLS